jgi:hypothetical protein
MGTRTSMTLRVALLAALLVSCGGPRLDLEERDVPSSAPSCLAGQYVGTYECATTTSSSSTPSGKGPLNLDLVVGSPTTLVVAQGTTISTPESVGTITSHLSGTLDCTTDEFVGAFDNVMISAPPFGEAMIAGSANVSADYDTTVSPPMLVHGAITVGSAAADASASGGCTWSARLMGP